MSLAWNNPSGINVLLAEKPGCSFPQEETENCSRVKFQVKMQVVFFKNIFSPGVFLNKSIPGFSIKRLANVADFLADVRTGDYPFNTFI